MHNLTDNSQPTPPRPATNLTDNPFYMYIDHRPEIDELWTMPSFQRVVNDIRECRFLGIVYDVPLCAGRYWSDRFHIADELRDLNSGVCDFLEFHIDRTNLFDTDLVWASHYEYEPVFTADGDYNPWFARAYGYRSLPR